MPPVRERCVHASTSIAERSASLIGQHHAASTECPRVLRYDAGPGCPSHAKSKGAAGEMHVFGRGIVSSGEASCKLCSSRTLH